MLKLRLLISLSFVVLLCLPAPLASAVSPHVVISEVAMESLNLSHEFIEIHNNSPLDVSLDGWKLQIRSASGTLVRTVGLSRTLRPYDTAMVASTAHATLCPVSDFTCFSATMTPTGGTVQLIDQNNVFIDSLGWGTATLGEGTIAPAPWLTVLSLQRKPGAASQLLDTDENAHDFETAEQAPQYGGLYTPDDVPPSPTTGSSCTGLSITEIMPNPAGDDVGREFIELYNPGSQPVDLAGCKLVVASNQLSLSGSMPSGYQAFYGLVLPNGSGATVELHDTSGGMQVVTYPANLKDDEAFGMVEGQWIVGLVPSPGLTNTINADSPATSTSAILEEACPPGKYRNTETNRCRTIEVVSPLTPCKPGQERSSETNRCRSTAGSSSIVACNPGEIRNPETNRCRKQSAAATQTTCKPGQERNPETNRCRKVATPKSSNPISSPASAARPISYYALGIIAVLAIAYGLYEYRDGLKKLIIRMRRRQ